MSNNTAARPAPAYDRYRKNRPIDIVCTLFLLFIATVSSIYMHDKYFDITASRGKAFTYGVIFFVILAVMSYAVEIFMIKYYEPEAGLFYKDSSFFAMPEIWILLYLIANVIACCLSIHPSKSWDGSNGRFFGLSLVLIIVLMFIVLSREAYISNLVLVALSFTSFLAYGIAYLQHFGYNPFGLRTGVVERQKEMFISLFGNLNTYASYICLSLPIFIAIFIFGEKLWTRSLATVVIVFAGAGIIPAKSDNVYLGIGVCYIVLLFISIYHKKFTEYVFSVFFLMCGLEAMAILNHVRSGSQKHINGIAKIIENPKVMFILLALVLVILTLSLIFRTINYEKYKGIQCGKTLVVIAVIMVISMAAVVILGIRSGSDMFKFNDEWGTYRGYIWRRSWSLFVDASPKRKLIGYGNESIAKLMKDNYYDEMVMITGKKYDNSHNELLQILVTTGLFGLITYLGFVAVSFIYMGKRMMGSPVVIACIAAGASYFAQSIVTLNQPITTPFFYVILASGIGYIRYRDSRRKYREERGE